MCDEDTRAGGEMTERLSDERLRDLADDDVSAMTAPWPEIRAMAAEVIALRTLCDEVYQVVGVLAHEAGVFETADVKRVLNNLVAAGSGQPLPYETLLPFDVSQQDARAAGPLMPEVSSDAIIRAISTPSGWPTSTRPSALYASIRAALLKEQGR